MEVTNVDVDAVLDQERHEFVAVVAGGQVQERALEMLVLHVDVGAARDQEYRGLGRTRRHGGHQRGVPYAFRSAIGSISVPWSSRSSTAS